MGNEKRHAQEKIENVKAEAGSGKHHDKHGKKEKGKRHDKHGEK